MLNNVKSTTLGDVLTVRFHNVGTCSKFSVMKGCLPEEIFKCESRDVSTWYIYLKKKGANDSKSLVYM